MRWRGDYFRINVKKWNFMHLNKIHFMFGNFYRKLNKCDNDFDDDEFGVFSLL